MENDQPLVEVGIMESHKIKFTFIQAYYCEELDTQLKGIQSVEIVNQMILFKDQYFESLHFKTVDQSATFQLQDVVIGKAFHWERKENQVFEGDLFIKVTGEKQLSAINSLPVENYLLSVISSEMSADASLELLKAHAVISRSWLMKKLSESAAKALPIEEPLFGFETPNVDKDRIIKWYESDAHQYYDVCADDHCQRYQGLNRATTPKVTEAIQATKGEVLMYQEGICDARFSKCCGGMSELFSSCWASEDYDYLKPVRDREQSECIDLTNEQAARAWILSSPESYCNTQDSRVLKQIMNDYDQETPDFYRWRVVYSHKELSELIARKSGIDFGDIIRLKPLLRGPSGRIIELLIEGSKVTKIVGKELEIRRYLSESHLYSSAFVVEKTSLGFEIIGAGWGHGVGLCQIGAAMMAQKGQSYQQILTHYFQKATVEKYY